VKQKRHELVAEALFGILLLVLAYLYATQPARKDLLTRISDKWRVLGELVHNPYGVLVAPFDWSTVELHGLARFGDELEFLGCDVAITRDDKGTHVWQVTIWRALAPLQQDYTVYMHFVKQGDSQPFFAQADHLLGQQFLGGVQPTTEWEPGKIVLDAVMLPEEAQRESLSQICIGVWVPESRFRLPVTTQLLRVDEYGRLLICE
jgi:hypothetical protein